jgi:putative pyruvate formate lyase activating enzyme
LAIEVTQIRPAYRRLFEAGELIHRAELARQHERACDLCARHCRVDRGTDRLGACRTGLMARVASYGPHHGEENPLRGWRGSGTIFFTWCNLRCQYCQNHDISQAAAGGYLTSPQLAEIMLELQAAGCHNINLVSPSHVVAEILEALVIACGGGLHLPLVYNTGGYDSPQALALLDGVIDIYMPDMKYSQAAVARRYSRIGRYPEVNRAAVREMHRQVGDLVIGDDGLAIRGLLVRHLVLPGGLAGTREIVRFLTDEISSNTYLNLMDQYRPDFKAYDLPPLDRRTTSDEFAAAVKMARQAGLNRFDRISF